MIKLETIYKNLINSGIKARYDFLGGCAEPKKIIIVDCNYEGPYPTKETFTIIDQARKIARDHKTEPRGYYSALFIY